MQYRLLIIGLILLGCDTDNPSPQMQQLGRCSDKAREQIAFTDTREDDFIFRNVAITDDCLSIKIAFGGGCGDVNAELITDGTVEKSLPPQRYLILAFTDDDPCEALLEEQYDFDLSALQVTGSNSVILNLKGWNAKIRYDY